VRLLESEKVAAFRQHLWPLRRRPSALLLRHVDGPNRNRLRTHRAPCKNISEQNEWTSISWDNPFPLPLSVFSFVLSHFSFFEVRAG